MMRSGGKGTFKKVMAGIDKLLELEKEGIYQGKNLHPSDDQRCHD
ncbi:hypothetical protein ACFTAO_13775 [Paenibacillus rhizoplanae]